MYRRAATGLVTASAALTCALGYGYRVQGSGWGIFGAVIVVILLMIAAGILVAGKD